MDQIKKNIEKKVVTRLKDLRPTCGECAGFSTEILRDKKLCKNVDGISISSKPCKEHFTPNTGGIRKVVANRGGFRALTEIVSVLEDAELRTLGALLMFEKRTRKVGLQLGQKVYVRYRGRAGSNYLSNFMTAFIMYADRNMIRVTSEDGKACMTFVGRAREAVIHPDAFDTMREKMIKKSKFVDPEVQRNISKLMRCTEEYELGLAVIDMGDVPTIDQVFKRNKVRKSKESHDLVSIVKAIENGFDVRKSPPSSSKSRKARKGGVIEIDVS